MPLPAIAAGLSLVATIGADAGGFISSVGKAATKAKDFGKTVGDALHKAKENVLPLWAGLQLIHSAVNLILGPSEVMSDIFSAFNDVIGAFSDILAASLWPALQPVLQVLVDMLPKWTAIFGTPEWTASMVALGDALKELVNVGMEVLFEVVRGMISALPAFIGFIIQVVGIFADMLHWVSQNPAFLQAIGQGLGIIVGAVIALGATGILALFTGIAVSIGAFALVVKFLVDKWPEIKKFFETFEKSLPLFERFVSFSERILEIWNAIVSAFRSATDLMGKVAAAPGNVASTVGDFFGGLIPHFQGGGIMPRTGLAMLHAGETVTPAGGGGGGITINVPVQNFYGTRENMEELARMIGEVFRQHQMSSVNTIR